MNVIGNILHYLRHGCRLALFIAPDDRSVLVFLPNQQPEILQGGDRLPLVEGIEIELTADRVFGWLKMGA